jgi:hypothetical protein
MRISRSWQRDFNALPFVREALLRARSVYRFPGRRRLPRYQLTSGESSCHAADFDEKKEMKHKLEVQVTIDFSPESTQLLRQLCGFVEAGALPIPDYACPELRRIIE